MIVKIGHLVTNVKKEVQCLSKKIFTVNEKKNKKVEQVLSTMLKKLLKDKNKINMSEEVKNEIIHKLTSYNKGKNIIPILKYVNKTILKNMPKNLKSAKNFKRNILNTLIKDAQKRLELSR